MFVTFLINLLNGHLSVLKNSGNSSNARLVGFSLGKDPFENARRKGTVRWIL